ncbi:adenylate/guanylate cyclase domain-containing protein [Sulfuriflexus sp.]|uniref:adenylate/guanylate cyclase domain-containing protein n=1 Tax=Sulfuriflexus sp. TaxID=2015443 RepID=UPI0028CE9419|nr:adenylate/guanylate cyclase domain-containing protein [Sulfuriflexus sp.]MDT8403177.1 adenylate/guanylate cyclase domain-containing protein [Sulfuriflexus sp.]
MRNNYLPLTYLALGVLLLATVEYGLLNILVGTENELSDSFVRVNAEPLQPDPDIIIVDIDNYSLDRMANDPDIDAGRYPWPRAIHAELLEAIRQQQPKAVLYDVLFTDLDNSVNAGSDAYFAEVASATDNLYFAIARLPVSGDDKSNIDLEKAGAALGFVPTTAASANANIALALPIHIIDALLRQLDSDVSRIGIVNFNADSDGVGRRYDLYQEAYGWQIPSLPARVARDLDYPLPQGESIRLHWRGGVFAHHRIAFYDLFKSIDTDKEDKNGRPQARDAHELRDKIVVIGATATSLGDLRASPISSLQPGVEFVATAMDNLKNQRYMQEPHKAFAPLLTVLVIMSLLFTFRYTNNHSRIFFGYVGLTGLTLLASYLAVNVLVIVPVLRPLVFGWLFYTLAALYSYLSERRTRERSIQMFGRFVDPRVVNDLVSMGDAGLTKYFNAQRTQVTVLFSDIRGFTTMSQHREPEEIVALLNKYFGYQTAVIFKHGGTVDKFIGDAIMAFWGAPISDPGHAQHAVEAALEMIEVLQAFRREIGGEIGESFDIGIGIHSGEAVVGMIGSENKLDYTCIGDTVNTASRLEGQTKDVARILVSAATKSQCGDTLEFIDHGSVSVKGRDEQVRIFEPRH